MKGNSTLSILLEVQRRWQYQRRASLSEYQVAVKRTEDALFKTCAKCTEVLGLVKQLPAGADCSSDLKVLNIVANGEKRSQKFSDITQKHMKTLPKDPMDTIGELGLDLEAAITRDEVNRMVAECCSSFDSARADILPIEEASLADMQVLQEMKTALIAQLEKVRDDNRRKLLEEESEQQQPAATKTNKRTKKSSRKARNTRVCGTVQSTHETLHHSEDDSSMMDRGLAHVDATKSADWGAASSAEPSDHASDGDGNIAMLGIGNAIVALLSRQSLCKSWPDQKLSTGVRQLFKEGSRAQKLHSGLGGGLALEEFLRHLCCPITEDIIEDAVIASDGVSYERSAIKARCQLSNDPRLTQHLLPNRSLQDVIEQLTLE